MRTIDTHTTIDAPAAVVWAALTDTAAYPRWSQFLLAIDGQLTVGERLSVEIAPPEARARTFRPTVTVVDHERCLEWLGHVGVRGIFDGRHRFELIPEGPSTTTLRHSEQFTGLLVAPMWRSLVGPTTQGFELFNAAIAERSAQLLDAAC